MNVVDWLYPKKCVGCGKRGRYFCLECLRTVRLKDDWVCPECNRSSVGGRAHLGCRGRYGLDGLVSLLSYQGMVRLGVQRLKYEFIREIRPEFLRLLSWGMKEKLRERQGFEWREFLRKRPVVTAVPLHWRRENWRGFNQAELIAEMIEESLGLEKKSLVERIKATQPQVELGREARAKNVRIVFKIRRGVDLATRVLVVDDVWTTGATMRAVGECLKRAGVKEVWGLSLAR